MILFVVKKQGGRAFDAPGIEVVSEEDLPPIDGKIVVVVGNRELAERLGAAYMSEEEALRFVELLKSESAWVVSRA
ncbi:MAG: hypothetical protein RQ839_03605 [Thermoproteus sp.]|nr:hypothetical protein [Thermoproteus sp.]MDT7882220.1 hypothetical protein [Thermoproteus sp.]